MKWGLGECTYRDNAVEGEVNDYCSTGGYANVAWPLVNLIRLFPPHLTFPNPVYITNIIRGAIYEVREELFNYYDVTGCWV